MEFRGTQSAWVCYAAMFTLSNFDYEATVSCVRPQQSGGHQQLRPSEGVVWLSPKTKTHLSSQTGGLKTSKSFLDVQWREAKSDAKICRVSMMRYIR